MDRQPLSNFDMSWCKKVSSEFVKYALRELGGDDMRPERRQLLGYDWNVLLTREEWLEKPHNSSSESAK
jgi:hypothetical protein